MGAEGNRKTYNTRKSSTCSASAFESASTSAYSSTSASTSASTSNSASTSTSTPVTLPSTSTPASLPSTSASDISLPSTSGVTNPRSADAHLDRVTKLLRALNDIKSGQMNLEQASRAHRIAKTTLHDHLSGKSKKYTKGRNKVYSEKEEQLILNDLKAALRRKEMSVLKCRRRVYKIVENRKLKNYFNPTEKKAGRKWFDSFCNRYQLDIRAFTESEENNRAYLAILPPKQRLLKTYSFFRSGKISTMNSWMYHQLRKNYGDPEMLGEPAIPGNDDDQPENDAPAVISDSDSE